MEKSAQLCLCSEKTVPIVLQHDHDRLVDVHTLVSQPLDGVRLGHPDLPLSLELSRSTRKSERSTRLERSRKVGGLAWA